jgi:hypothetical protein
MIKQISITFNFDTETEEVSNIKTTGSIEAPKKRTTKKVKELEVDNASEAILTLEETKLVLNSKLVAELEAEAGDRINVFYNKAEGSKKLIPFIEVNKDDEGSGNKMTKTNTVIYKGKQNTVLATFGNEFTISKISDNLWKLNSSSINDLSSDDSVSSFEAALEKAEKFEPELLVEGDDTIEIDELQFKL